MTLKYWADLRTLGFVTVYFALVIGQWIWFPTTWYIAIPLVLATCWFSFSGAVITHNTIHHPIFEQRWANQAFQIVLSMVYGHPTSSYVPGHNLSHHKYTQGPRDVMRTTKVYFRYNLFNVLFFFSRVSLDILKAEIRFVKAMWWRNRVWFWQLVIESVIFFGACGFLLVLDWRKFVLYILIPHQFAAWGIVTMNYLQHDGCDIESPYNHSRNFLGRVVNWCLFNNGFHSIHHKNPGLHWSLARERHMAEFHGKIHPALEQPSLLTYIFKAYVWPGKRLRFDGAALTIPPPGKDDEWVPGPKDDLPDVSFGAIR